MTKAARDLVVGDRLPGGKVIESIEPGRYSPDYVIVRFEKGEGMFWFDVFALDDNVELV